MQQPYYSGYGNSNGNMNGNTNGGWNRTNGNGAGFGYNYGNSFGNQNVQPFQRIYVNGRAGADAYPLPQGVNEIVLWDTEAHRYYVKGYDNNGIPRVIEDNDYTPHVEPVREEMTITKDDIRAMIEEAVAGIGKPNMSGFVTQKELNRVINRLCVGNGGKVVMGDE